MVTQSELERPLQLNAWGYDVNDMDMVAESLTEDAVMIATPDGEMEDPALFGGGDRRTEGREAIVAQLRGSRGGMAERGERPRHVISNILVERATDEEADVRCFYTFYMQSPEGGTSLRGVSTYYDHLVNDGGTWRIQTRRNVGAHFGSRMPKTEEN